MINLDLYPEIEICEDDLNAMPENVLQLLTIVFEDCQNYRAQVHGLLDENALLKKRIEELESKSKKNSTNSNNPPSSDSPFKKPRPKRGNGKPGAKPGHKGHRQKLLEPTKGIPIEPEVCSCGCKEFSNNRPYHTHQEIELPEIEMIITHFVLEEGECVRCGKTVQGNIPSGHHTGYGPRFSALIGQLAGVDGNSRETVQTFCSSVLGIKISLGGIQNVIDRVSRAILPHYDKIGETVRDETVNHVDETSWKLSGALNWLWVLCNSVGVFFMLHTHRSNEGFQELVAGWVGILVSDGYKVYQKWVGLRQTCLAHLIRAAKGLEERNDPELSRFGTWARKELQRLCKMADKKPTQGEWLAFYARLSHLISRYRDCDNEAGVFARRLEREMEHLFLFLKEEGVEPTNNFAERMIRFAVLWRKRSQGTRTQKGNRWVERILSLRQTCRLHGKSTFHVLADAIDCFLKGLQPDLSWIGKKNS
jgi:transposase